MFGHLGSKKILTVFGILMAVVILSLNFEQKTFAVAFDGGPVCSYPNPPMGCNYIEGPSYNPMNQCGMVMECGEGEDLPIDGGGGPMCQYAAPPENCNYVEGPEYDGDSGCGLVLSCAAEAPQVGDMIPVSNSADRASMGDSSHANASTPVALTPNGRYALFHSYATNLVHETTNGQQHVFVKNTLNQFTALISQNNLGTQGNNDSMAIDITPDGRYVLFNSLSNNLAGTDSNSQRDTFLRDTITNTTTRISQSAAGVGGNSWSMGVAMSEDGRYILFNSFSSNLVPGDTNGSRDMFIKDRVANTITRISVNDLGEQGDSDSVAVSMTPDGRYVLFTSDASTYTSNDTNWQQDIFVRDNIRGRVVQVNVNDAGDPGNEGYASAFGITSDGRYVLFQSPDSNLVVGDTNNSNQDIFVRDLTRSKTYLVNKNELGTQLLLSSPKAITEDGRYVVFEDFANGNALFRRDMQANKTVKIGGDQSVGLYQSAVGTNGKTISSNGRYILYGKNTPSNRQVYLYDIYLNVSKDVTKNTSGVVGNGDSHGKLITSDGRFVLLYTKATNFLAGVTDTNGQDDIFVKDMLDGILYTDPAGVYKFYYPRGLQFKNPTNTASIGVVFSKSGTVYAGLAPVITVAKGASNKSLSQVVAGVTQAYRNLFRNNFTVTTEIERTAHGVPTKQLHITGKIAGVDKVYIVTFIRLLSKVYVVSANGTMSNASTLDSIVDMIISTRKYSPIPAGVDGNPTCLFCE